MNKLITLTTDFGLTDEYVGVMKGVIYNLAPNTQIIDLCHGIEPQNIAQAAYLINSSTRYFSDNTIHIVVVDPGVGGNRRLILIRARKQLFLAPDNGVLTLLLNNKDFEFARAITNKELFTKPTSQTFHGRDILAPIAAHLATGATAEKIGPLVNYNSLTQLNLAPTIISESRKIMGTVIQVDRFGNLITNIERPIIQRLIKTKHINKITVTIGSKTFTNHTDCYDEALPGELLSLFGSRGYLEISLNQGNAAKFLGISLGEIVELQID